MQGIGAYQPFLDAAQQTQAAALGTTGAGVQALGQMNFDPNSSASFHGSISTSSYTRSIKRSR
jgi:hypothetical protein